MKKYRCPCCGEECITLRQKIYCSHYDTHGYASVKDSHGTRCPDCGGMYENYLKARVKLYYIELVIFSAIFLPLVFLTLFVNTLYAGALALYFLLLVFLIVPLLNISLPIVKYKNREDDPEVMEYVVPEPNAKVIIKRSTGKIRHLYIYGIKLDRKTNNARFHEAFTNDLVPVVFHKKDKKQEGETEVTIMKKEFIPDDLLFYGSEFTVIDNGKEIASGLLVSVYEQQKSEEHESAGGLAE